ncbi:hypothetical protein Tsubulata_008536 [Turnera subulata]|uniref:Phospholipase/carboxylesterase/thioesterase domain-containing protein n=1 Tax=Turnera subulata TaxID=218843 RepID=A0A9Q0F8A5_9ROSI|nr:hypothetical protein Tsubulata_008536 [Turnera subulata]
MSYNNSSAGSGSRTTTRRFEFGRTHVVRPKGKHQATIVWLHGLGDKGSSWSQLLETLPLPNIKWICPTAPTRPVALFGGFPCTACKNLLIFAFFYSIDQNHNDDSMSGSCNLSGFDVGDISEEGPDDLEGLDASAAHVANLLSTEPSDVKLGIGGFSMGAATALYSATCRSLGQYGNGNLYPVNISVILALSGWLPCARTLRTRVEGSHEAARRAASLPILLCHGLADDVVPYKLGEKSAETLHSAGFRNVIFRTYNGLGHYTIPEETDEVCSWLTTNLALEGSWS